MALVDISLPKMGATMTEGTIAAWHMALGESISMGSVMCEVETDKVRIDIESEVDGVVAELTVEEGATVAVGTVIARVSV
ncbi:MAG: lipoyl domain-containing protein [Vulcanimicrobiaceae bacterium]